MSRARARLGTAPDDVRSAAGGPGRATPSARRGAYGDGMRWEALFADMEAQLDAVRAAELAADVADLTRAERATVALTSRLRAAQDTVLTVRVAGGEPVSGIVVEVAEQWLLLADGPRRALVPMTAVAAVADLPVTAQPSAGVHVSRRLGLGHALRALARDRVVVRVATHGGELVGRLDRVGADHVDLTVGGEAARARPGAAVTAWTVPIAAIRVVRSG